MLCLCTLRQGMQYARTLHRNSPVRRSYVRRVVVTARSVPACPMLQQYAPERLCSCGTTLIAVSAQMYACLVAVRVKDPVASESGLKVQQRIMIVCSSGRRSRGICAVFHLFQPLTCEALYQAHLHGRMSDSNPLVTACCR